MASIFTRILQREIPGYIVAENEHFIAFLDIQPLAKGHALVVPKQEMDYLFDYDDTTLSRAMVFAKKVALAIQKCIPCKRVGMAVVGFEVPHAHIHLIPMNNMEDMDFFKAKLTLSEQELSGIADKLKKAFQP